MAKAQKGDLIRIVKYVEHAYGGYKIGDILEVADVDVYGDEKDVTVTSDRCILYDDEYEIYRKQAHTAQVGDLIRITKVRDGVDAYKLGGIYEVISLDATHYDQIVIEGEGGAVGFIFADEYEVFRKAGEEDTCVCGKQGVHTCRGADYYAAKAQDAVNSPNHYTQGRFETIEIIEEIAKGYDDGFTAYCVGNALKYLARAPFKHEKPTEDLRKAAKYLRFAIDGLTRK